MIKVLTVRDPWASAIIFAGKDVENRKRNLAGAYRGPVAIHVSTTFDKASLEIVGDHPIVDFFDWNPRFGPDMQDDEGSIIGVVDLVDVHPYAECVDVGTYHEHADGAGCQRVDACSNWADQADVQHLVLENPRALQTPIPFKGALHLQTASAAVEAEIVRQIGAV